MIRRFGSGGPYEDVIGYSRVVIAGEWAVTAGCTAVVNGELVHRGDAGRQAATAFDIAIAALADAGCAREQIVQTRMYITTAGDADAVGQAHAAAVGDVRPAASMIVVAGFVDPGMLVEVELTGWLGGTAGTIGA